MKKKQVSAKKLLIENELKRRRSEEELLKQIMKQKEKERKAWLKEHKRLYLLNVKNRNPKVYRQWLRETKKLPLWIDFVRWVLHDLTTGKYLYPPLWGIYLFVANPGQGKTISMVKHIEELKAENPTINVFTNFNYKGQNGPIRCWQDIVRVPPNSVVGIDEVHLTFESSDYRNFPEEMLAQLSLNRKIRKQFLCSTQRYERVNKNFRDLANYVVVCKNYMNLDRLFIRAYYDKKDYDAVFDGKSGKANFIKPYVATDELYRKYDTLELIGKLVEEADDLKTKEHEILPTLDRLLYSKVFNEKEIKTIMAMQSRIKEEITAAQKKHQADTLLLKLSELDEKLHKDFKQILS